MTQIDGDAVILRPLGPGDQDEFVAQARASVTLHHPWYSMPTTREGFQTYLAKFRQPTAEGFLVCLRDRGALAGMITIDSIIRGRFQSAASMQYGPGLAGAGGTGVRLRGALRAMARRERTTIDLCTAALGLGSILAVLE
jgi:hypothetical protein